MKKRMKKLIVLGMCVMLVGSTGIVSNAASGAFSMIYVDYPEGNNYTAKKSKEKSTSYATVKIDELTTTSHTGHYMKVRRNGTAATESLTLKSKGTKNLSYLTGKGAVGSGYDAYFYSVSATAGMYISGSWNPN